MRSRSAVISVARSPARRGMSGSNAEASETLEHGLRRRRLGGEEELEDTERRIPEPDGDQRGRLGKRLVPRLGDSGLTLERSPRGSGRCFLGLFQAQGSGGDDRDELGLGRQAPELCRLGAGRLCGEVRDLVGNACLVVTGRQGLAGNSQGVLGRGVRRVGAVAGPERDQRQRELGRSDSRQRELLETEGIAGAHHLEAGGGPPGDPDRQRHTALACTRPAAARTADGSVSRSEPSSRGSSAPANDEPCSSASTASDRAATARRRRSPPGSAMRTTAMSAPAAEAAASATALKAPSSPDSPAMRRPAVASAPSAWCARTSILLPSIAVGVLSECLRLTHMAQPARRLDPDDALQLDPAAVQQAYRLHRARRRARRERTREVARARLRFWLVLIVLVGLSVWLTVVVWHQIERLFGL